MMSILFFLLIPFVSANLHSLPLSVWAPRMGFFLRTRECLLDAGGDFILQHSSTLCTLELLQKSGQSTYLQFARSKSSANNNFLLCFNFVLQILSVT